MGTWASELNHGAMEEGCLVWWITISFKSSGWSGACAFFIWENYGNRMHYGKKAGNYCLSISASFFNINTSFQTFWYKLHRWFMHNKTRNDFWYLRHIHVHTEPKRRFRAQGQTYHKASSTDRGHRTSLTMITVQDSTSTRDLISNFLIHTKQTELYRSSLYLHSSPPCPWLSFRLDSGQQQQTQRVSFHQALFGLCLSH